MLVAWMLLLAIGADRATVRVLPIELRDLVLTTDESSALAQEFARALRGTGRMAIGTASTAGGTIQTRISRHGFSCVATSTLTDIATGTVRASSTHESDCAEELHYAIDAIASDLGGVRPKPLEPPASRLDLKGAVERIRALMHAEDLPARQNALIRHQGCSIVVAYPERVAGLHASYAWGVGVKTEATIPLDALDPSRVRLMWSGSSLDLRTRADRPVIELARVTAGPKAIPKGAAFVPGSKKVPVKEKRSWLRLDFMDIVHAEQITQALVRAVELCKGRVSDHFHPESLDDAWATAELESERLGREPLSAMERAIDSGTLKRITSVLIARHGRLVYEAYFDPPSFLRGPWVLRDTRSVTKTITGMLAGIALTKSALPSLDAKALPFFRDQRIAHPDPAKEAITVEELLTMSSALDCNDWNDDSPGNEEKMYPLSDWLDFALGIPARKERGFSYCTAGVFLLGQILARASKMPIETFSDASLFAPLGIRDVEWARSPLGLAQTGGGLRMKSRDLLRLAQLYLDHGNFRGAQIIPEQWVETSIAPHARIDARTEYGYLWWLKTFTAPDGRAFRAAYMSGNGGNKVLFFPDLALDLVITTTNYNTRGMHDQTDRMVSEHVLGSVH
jgi:CubicO group peptidase (beta-lactamase class C family)